MPVVIVDAVDTASVEAHRHSIALRRWDGTVQALTGGYDTIHYERHSSGTTRLAAQFDASGFATGAYAFDVIVTSHWDLPGYPARQRVVPVTVLVVNEGESPFGWGWSAPGVQRAHTEVNQGANNHGVNGVVITEGDGSAKLFAGSCAFTSANCTFTSPEGEFSRLVYTGGSVTTIFRTYPDGSTAAFDASGRLAYVQDRFGNRTGFGWSGETLTSVRDSSWSTTPQSITLHYTDGQIDSIRSPDGRTSHITIGGTGNVTEIRNPLGQRVLKTIAYNAGHQLTSYRDLSGSLWSLQYDFSSRLRRITAPWVPLDGNPADTIRPETVFLSGERTLLQNETSGEPANPRAGRATTAYRVNVTAPGGVVTSIRLDRWRQPTMVIEDFNGALERVSAILSYNSAGQLTRDSSHTGRVVTNTWTGPVLTSTRTTQGGTGRPATTLEYDTTKYYALRIMRVDTAVIVEHNLTALGLPDTTWAGGRPTSTTVDTVFTARAFNARGQLTSTTTSDTPGEDAHTTLYGYSPTTGNTSSMVAPGARWTFFGHDVAGRVERVIDPLSDTTRYTFDALNRTLTTTDAMGEVSTTVYGDSLHLLTFTDAIGQEYRQQFDRMGRPVWEEDPLDARIYLGFDVDGRLIRTTNRRGQHVRFWYDDLGRPTMRVAETEADSLTYTYSANGRSMTMSNAEATIASIADPRRMSDTIAVSIDTLDYKLVYNTHHLRFTLYEVEFHRPDDGYIYSTYLIHGGAGQLVSITPPTQGATTIAYENDLGSYRVRAPLAGESFPITTVKATSDGVPGQVNYLNSAHQAAFGRDIERDDLGRAVRSVDADRDSSWEYTLDANGRLTSATRRAGNFAPCTWDEDSGSGCADWGTTEYDHSFGWDEVGNPTHRNAHVDPGNRLRAMGYSSDRDSLAYDADGNLTHHFKGGGLFQTLTWNSLGQLTKVLLASGDSVIYGYAPTGERVRRTEGGSSTYYVWDRGNVTAELTGAGVVTHLYSYYGGLDSPHSMTIGDSTFYYVLSPPGNVVGLLNESAAIVNRYEYSPFGEGALTQEASYAQNLRRFAGAEIDTVTGLYYMRNRWFSPRLQRFISEDPIGLRGGINQYEYANGNPIGLRDPSGLDPCFYNPGSKWDEDSNGPIGVSDCSLIGTTYTVDARLFAGGIEFNSPSDMSDREEPYRKRSQTNDETQYAVPAASVEPPSLGQCAAAHYDIESGALQAFLVTPIPKAALGVPTMVGSSPFTNAISAIGHFLAPGLRMPFKVMGTSRVFGALGRIGVVAGVGMLAFDATSIGLCASRYGL